jgi:transposase
MPNSYPLVYKEYACNYYFRFRKHQSIKEIVNILNISNGTLYNWINAKNNNNLKNKIKYKKRSKYTSVIKCYIRSYVISRVNFDYKRLMTQIKKKYKITISKSAIYDILSKMNVTRKKFKERIIPNKSRLKKQIRQFKKTIKGISLDKIVSIDETSINTNSHPLYGWSMKGKKIIKIHKKSRVTYTIISAISSKKIIYNEIIKGSSNSAQFKEFLIKVISKLKEPMYLLMDNARIHHSKLVKEYINDKTNHKIIYNVPYCPEYNPIEIVFSKFKSIILKKDNSSHKKMLHNIHQSFKKITTSDLINFYNHSLLF